MKSDPLNLINHQEDLKNYRKRYLTLDPPEPLLKQKKIADQLRAIDKLRLEKSQKTQRLFVNLIHHIPHPI
jgi:hypothetical protein